MVWGETSRFLPDNHDRFHVFLLQDPGLNCIQKPGSYQPYDLGLKLDLFIKNHTGQQLVGMVNRTGHENGTYRKCVKRFLIPYLVNIFCPENIFLHTG